MHLAPIIYDLAIILSIAGLMSLLFQKIKQPVVLGYILAGVIVGPYTPPFQLVVDIPGIQIWAELGVIFLMFTLGLEFSFRKLLSVGVTAGVSAGLEVIFFLAIGYGLGIWLGWTPMDSIFLGAMLSISSTTIIIKALEELNLKSHRFAGLIFGILIVEDLFAILLLVGLTTVASTQTISFVALGSASLKLLIVVGSWFITGYFIVPRLISQVERKGNNEMLTLISIGLCLLLVVLASYLGYSPALGAFIMGSILAETKVIHRIENLMGPLRDLFGAIFFVSIGMLIDPRIMWEYKSVIALISVVVILGKIFINSLGAMITGQSFKNSMQVGFGLAQIGEFSFIIASLGLTLKATSNKLYPIGVAVSLVTTFTTPYLIKYSGPMADSLEKKLPWWFKDLQSRYVAWSEHKKGTNLKLKDFFSLVFRWLANGIIVTIIFDMCFKYISANAWQMNLTWLIAFLLSSPFIWGMVFTSRKNYLRIRKQKNFMKAILVLAFPVLTSIWIGILSAKHFPLKYILPLTATCLILIYFSLFKRLESYYRWFESTFLSTFEKKESVSDSASLIKLAPWDSHLVTIEVHPNAKLVNKSILEAKLRMRFGINIVAIQRGVHTMVAPGPEAMIFPGDKLIVLGTDDQLMKARPELEIPIVPSSHPSIHADYKLKHLTLTPDSTISGSTIRDSNIRENYQAMVVGIERSHNRILNPDTDFKMQAGDVVWVVGEQNMLEKLFDELG